MSENTTAIVTGGSRGIGRAVAIKLASLGTDIAVVATHDGSAQLKQLMIWEEKLSFMYVI